MIKVSVNKYCKFEHFAIKFIIAILLLHMYYIFLHWALFKVFIIAKVGGLGVKIPQHKRKFKISSAVSLKKRNNRLHHQFGHSIVYIEIECKVGAKNVLLLVRGCPWYMFSLLNWSNVDHNTKVELADQVNE